VKEVFVAAGSTVQKGQVLATLDDRDLRVERQRWLSEREQHESRYRDALSKHERANANVALAQARQADSQLALVEEKLARASIVAPFDGIVVTGDLSQLLGSPVEQGKLLFEIAPLDAYRVILKVEDRDIRSVRSGQSGSLVLSGLAAEALDFEVVNISMAQAENGMNVFRVEARLDRSDLKLRPGMEGVGKINAGERSYAWIWTHRMIDWLRLQAWSWLP
jgi:RND family efflux transporter MFP subunit